MNSVMDKILEIPKHHYQFGKLHILINPDFELLKRYKLNTIKQDHQVHIFIAWFTMHDINALFDFISNCKSRTIKKVIIHMPRSIDSVSKKYVDMVISQINQYDMNCKCYIEKDSVQHEFIMNRINLDKISINSIYNHKFKVLISKWG